MCISSNTYTNKNYKIDFDHLVELVYRKSAEEEAEERHLVLTAELWLEGRGIEVKQNMVIIAILGIF